MLTLFACTTVDHPTAPVSRGVKVPLVYALAIQQGVQSTTPMAHMQVPGTSQWCAGVADLTQAQFDALDARTDVFVLLAQDRKTVTVSQLPAGMRQKINTWLTDRGIDPGIKNSDTLQEAFRKLIQLVEPLEDLVSIVRRFNAAHGRSEQE